MPDKAVEEEGHVTSKLPNDVIATPEGDNETAPDQPLKPSTDDAVEGLETPLGSGDLPYKKDKD